MRDLGGAIIRQAKRDISEIGFEQKSGLLLPDKPSVKGKNGSDEQVANEGVYFIYPNSMNALNILSSGQILAR
jgi:hypothetical protein